MSRCLYRDGADAELRRITADYTIEFARVLHGSGRDAVFSFLSGKGTDPTGHSGIPFARYKGEAESALLRMGFSRVYLFRPAYIYPVDPRKEPNVGYRLLRAVYPVFRVLFPNQEIELTSWRGPWSTSRSRIQEIAKASCSRTATSGPWSR